MPEIATNKKNLSVYAKKLQKSIHVKNNVSKKRHNLYISPKQYPAFSKESIMADISRQSYSVCCHAAFIGGKLLRSCKLE